MKFLPSLRHREPRSQAPPPPEPGLNADYYDANIPFGPFPPSSSSSPPFAHPNRAQASDRHRRQPPSPGFHFGGYEEDHAPRIVRGHRKPPTRYAKETSSPIYFAPDPPTPGSYLHRSSPRHDQDGPHDRDHRRAGRSRRHREHRSPDHEDEEGRPTDYRSHNPEEPYERRRRRSSRREPPSPQHEQEYEREHEHARRSRHQSPRPRSRSRHRHPSAWNDVEARHSRHRPSPPPSPVHRPREVRERNIRRRHDSRPRDADAAPGHRDDRAHRHGHGHGHERHGAPAYRQHAMPSPPAAALQRAMATDWWKNPAVQVGARTALKAGAHALMKHRNEEGPWLGPKGAKIAGAALGAALADGLGGDGKK
ncbi:hypothetical protein ESCO_000067 [Escovopsis weberi]|uniref:Uncharacterized protein n=1 Tax=Escovopsis weberi TaxID=150374 RepID=A0A0N0RTJ0_ESCWE|nr:hypothetical protein ESCO_000067 [Escovopsis weberi]